MSRSAFQCLGFSGVSLLLLFCLRSRLPQQVVRMSLECPSCVPQGVQWTREVQHQADIGRCDVCGGVVLDNLTTISATSASRRVVVSMANRAVDLLAWFTLARSLRHAGGFNGTIILMWFGKHDEPLFCRLDAIVAELRLTLVCVRKPLGKKDIHKSVTGRSWDWVKLLSFTLVQFQEVMFADADMIMINRVDDLFSFPRGKDFLFISGSGALLNSGSFWMLPSLSHYSALMKLVQTGTYRKRDGWNHAGIVKGKNNHWDECQGLLYHHFAQIGNTSYELVPSPVNSPEVIVRNGTIVHFFGRLKPCPIAKMKPVDPVDTEMWSSWPWTAWEENFEAVFGDRGFEKTNCTRHVPTARPSQVP